MGIADLFSASISAITATKKEPNDDHVALLQESDIDNKPGILSYAEFTSSEEPTCDLVVGSTDENAVNKPNRNLTPERKFDDVTEVQDTQNLEENISNIKLDECTEVSGKQDDIHNEENPISVDESTIVKKVDEGKDEDEERKPDESEKEASTIINNKENKYPTNMVEVWAMLNNRWSTEDEDHPAYKYHQPIVDEMDHDAYIEYNMKMHEQPAHREPWEDHVMTLLKFGCALGAFSCIMNVIKNWNKSEYWA